MIAATSTSVESLRRCQAVLLPALFGAMLEQTADVLGLGRATVARLQAAFRKQRSVLPAADRNWGGRRQSLLTPAEEVACLQPWLASAATGNLVVVSPIRAALAQRARPAGQAGGGVSAAGPPWLAQGGPGHPASQAPTRGAGGLKKTPGSAGNPAASGRGQGATPAVDVSGCGALGTEGAEAALLGTGPATSGGGPRLRAGVSVCRREPSVRWQENWAGGSARPCTPSTRETS